MGNTILSRDGLERNADGSVKMVPVRCRRCNGPETKLVKQTIKGPGHWHCNACCLVLKNQAIAWLAAHPEPGPPAAVPRHADSEVVMLNEQKICTLVEGTEIVVEEKVTTASATPQERNGNMLINDFSFLESETRNMYKRQAAWCAASDA